MDATGSFARSELLIAAGAEVVSRARALRRRSESLRCDGERLRSNHHRLEQAILRRREAAGAWAKPQLFVPSPWSPPPWQSPSDKFEDVLSMVR